MGEVDNDKDLKVCFLVTRVKCGGGVVLTNSANIGRNMVAVAELLVTSVIQAMSKLITNTKLQGGRKSNPVKASPIAFDNPDF